MNESLGHESCIDYVLVSDAREVLDFAVTAPGINFSDHLPLTVTMQGGISKVDNKSDYDPKAKQLQLRWDRGDTMSFYRYTGHFLMPLLSSVEEMLLTLTDNNTYKQHQVDLAAFIDHVYSEIVRVLRSSADAHIPTCRKNFLKFWWDEELTLLKEASNLTNLGKPLANHDLAQFLTDGKLVAGNIVGALRNVKSAILKAIPMICTKLYYRKIIQTSGSSGALSLSHQTSVIK